MIAKKRAYIELHIAVFLYGFTGILGKLISLSELVLVWWRMFFAALGFLLFLPVVLPLLKRKNLPFLLKLCGIGVLVAIHWVAFFGSIKYSNVSVALVCFATTTFFTSILEPFLLNKKFNWLEVGLGIFIIPGMYFVVNGIDASMLTGVLLGFFSAFLAAVFSILNKRYANDAHPMAMTAVELSSGWLFLSLLMPFYMYYFPANDFLPSGWEDLVYLLILALLCTTLAYSLNLKAMQHISAFVANLTITLEPIYSIALAMWIFEENKELSTTFYIGVGIIMLSVFGHPLLQKRLK